MPKIPIGDVVDLLGLIKDPKNKSGTDSFNVRCPFCGDKKYHLNINTQKNVYFCFRCGKTDGVPTALDLYGRVRFGTPLVPNQNSRELYNQLAQELHYDRRPYEYKRPKETKPDEIYPKSDKALNEVYSAMGRLPYFTLSQEHKKNLLQRGFTEEALANKGYLTFPPPNELLARHPLGNLAKIWYNAVEKTHKENAKLKTLSAVKITVGLLIAQDLLDQGLCLENTPGFFTIGTRWCFRYEVGMAIPTRSYDGYIIGMQVRLDKNIRQLRYLTVSSKGFNNGVTTNIARVHFTKPLKQISQNTKVFLTEGPLKADLISFMMEQRNQDTLVIAILGVNNTKELPQLLPVLKQMHIDNVYSVLDMDKCCNLSVYSAQQKIEGLFQQSDINLISLMWDKEYAKIKYHELIDICSFHDVPVCLKSKNYFSAITEVAQLLKSHNIPFSSEWNNTSKGLDDYMAHLPISTNVVFTTKPKQPSM